MKSIRRWVVLAIGIVVSVSPAWAQADRHELGLRLRALEAAWSEPVDGKARERALPEIQRGVAKFLGFNLGESAKALDEARFRLRSAEPPSAAVRWAESLQMQIGCRLLDSADATVAIELSAFYAVPGEAPAKARIKVTLHDVAGKPLMAAFESPLQALPFRDKLPVAGLPEGDHVLRLEIQADDKPLSTREQRLSIVARRDARLRNLKKGLNELSKDAPRIGLESLRGLLKILEALASGQTLETAYPAARLLAEAEALLKSLADGQEYYGPQRPGEYWLTLPHGRGATPVRLLAPEAVGRNEPRPLVVALHGAGGSENLFFDGYGRGAIVELCRKRGWLLVAPRCPLFAGQVPVAELVEQCGKLYRVDPKKVFLVGHSMGAAQAVGAASLHPDAYAGVAALGGGGAPKASDGLKRVPFFVGVGSEDFALTGSRALSERLKKAEVKEVRFREYAGIEHLTIVQTALPDVFAWFDELAK
ncbi:MAG: hypothetical protein JNM56_32810 [Planctomycetia bacterium]|nr:hypothetical protein [Planctomycetia bacterium]